MNRSLSYILGYILAGVLLFGFVATFVIEKNVKDALTKAEELVSTSMGLTYQEVGFNLISGFITINDVHIDSIDKFSEINISESGIKLDWKDRYRLLFQSDFSPLQIQNLGLRFSKITMLEDEEVKWSLDEVDVALNGEAKTTFLALFKEKLPRRPFKSVIKAQNVSLEPSPILDSIEEHESFLFPISNITIISTYDPGLTNIHSDITISKVKQYAFKANANVVFTQNVKRELIPSKALIDFAFNGAFKKRPIFLSDEGAQFAFESMNSNGTMIWENQELESGELWTPTTASAEISFDDIMVFPSTDFVRKYGIFLQTFGFEQGFAGFTEAEAKVEFNNGELKLSSGKILAPWVEAEIIVNSSLLPEELEESPISNGNITITKVADPIRAGIRFVERQKQIKIINKSDEIVLPLHGTLGKPRLKNIFD